MGNASFSGIHLTATKDWLKMHFYSNQLLILDFCMKKKKKKASERNPYPASLSLMRLLRAPII